MLVNGRSVRPGNERTSRTVDSVFAVSYLGGPTRSGVNREARRAHRKRNGCPISHVM